MKKLVKYPLHVDLYVNMTPYWPQTDVDLYAVACWLGHGSTDYDGGYLWESFKKFLGDSTFPPIRCRYTVEEMPAC